MSKFPSGNAQSYLFNPGLEDHSLLPLCLLPFKTLTLHGHPSSHSSKTPWAWCVSQFLVPFPVQISYVDRSDLVIWPGAGVQDGSRPRLWLRVVQGHRKVEGQGAPQAMVLDTYLALVCFVFVLRLMVWTGGHRHRRRLGHRSGNCHALCSRGCQRCYRLLR